MNTPHRTLVILKPDGYRRNLLSVVLLILSRNARAYPKNIYTKVLDEGDVNLLYGRYEDQEFYQPLEQFMMSGPSIVMELVGNHAVSKVRQCVGGGPYPHPVGTLRGQLATSTRRNVVHCSDSAATARNELNWFFKVRAPIIPTTPKYPASKVPSCR